MGKLGEDILQDVKIQTELVKGRFCKVENRQGLGRFYDTVASYSTVRYCDSRF